MSVIVRQQHLSFFHMLGSKNALPVIYGWEFIGSIIYHYRINNNVNRELEYVVCRRWNAHSTADSHCCLIRHENVGFQ